MKPRRPDKIKPGTPHPTKAYTVRGFNGRWISRKSYNADRRRREKAAAAKKKGGAIVKVSDSKSTPKTTPKKGGSLVKRVSDKLVKTTKGTLTKASNKAGELLKIKKGDKGLVRGVKDLYKMGKDTRKSANALYKAGKITREVHDKLVKGGKDFFGGVRESGKATKRVVNALKPGGKLVAQAKKFNGVNYDLIPKSIRGALVKVSKDGGKSKTFKFDYNKIPKDLTKKTPTRYKAPKTRMPRKGKLVVDGKTVYTKRDIKGDIKNKAAGFESKIKKNVNKGKDAIKQRTATTRLKFSRPNASSVKANALKLNKYLRNNFSAKSFGGGLAKGGLYFGADLLANKAADKFILDPYKNMLDKWVAKKKAERKNIAPDGKLSFGNQPKPKPGMKTWKNPAKVPLQPEIKFDTKPLNLGTDTSENSKLKVNKNETLSNELAFGPTKKQKVEQTNVKQKSGTWSKIKKALKPGMSERQLKSQIRSLKRGSKGPSNRMKIKRLQKILEKKYG